MRRFSTSGELKGRLCRHPQQTRERQSSNLAGNRLGRSDPFPRTKFASGRSVFGHRINREGRANSSDIESPTLLREKTMLAMERGRLSYREPCHSFSSSGQTGSICSGAQRGVANPQRQSSVFANRQNRALGAADNILCNTAHQKVLQSGSAVRRQHDQVDLVVH